MADRTRTSPERRTIAQGALVLYLVTPATALLAWLAFDAEEPALGAVLAAAFVAFAGTLLYLALRRPPAAETGDGLPGETHRGPTGTRFGLYMTVVFGILAALTLIVTYAGAEYLGPMLAIVCLFVVFFAGHRVLSRSKTAEGRRSQDSTSASDDDRIPHIGMDDETPVGDSSEHSDVSSARRYTT